MATINQLNKSISDMPHPEAVEFILRIRNARTKVVMRKRAVKATSPKKSTGTRKTSSKKVKAITSDSATDLLNGMSPEAIAKLIKHLNKK